jgi:hypothetical protein
MCNVDHEKDSFQLSLYPTAEGYTPTPIVINDIKYDEYDNPRFYLYSVNPVSASWTTPPLDLGNDSIAKCLYTMTVTAETGKNAKFKFGYDTRMGRMERASQGLGAFSFDNIDFRDLSFETGFQNSFTVRARERNFNFIRFNIKSDEDAPCAVHRISAVYKYNKNNKGVV